MKLLQIPEILPGTYVLAVSGGVDSMVLLDVLARRPELKLVVAHFDHGIRTDSHEDAALVQEAAAAHGLSYIYGEGRLGSGSSEATARAARYAFLERARQTYDARAIVTAHHQDDLLETAILNLLRGTGRKGLSSLQSTNELLRPLLGVPKSQLLTYARAHNVRWREDSTNLDERYARNYVRRCLLPRLGDAGRAQLLAYVTQAAVLNADIDALLAPLVPKTITLERRAFVQLPYKISLEVLAAWLRSAGVNFDKRSLHRLAVAAKTLLPGKRASINGQWFLQIEKVEIRLLQLHNKTFIAKTE